MSKAKNSTSSGASQPAPAQSKYAADLSSVRRETNASKMVMISPRSGTYASGQDKK